MSIFSSMLNEQHFNNMLRGDFSSDMARNFPFHRINFNHIPKAGKDILREAESVVSLIPAEVTSRVDIARFKSQQDLQREFYANWFYYRSLYQHTVLGVEIKSSVRPVTMIPGHLWGYEPDGPRPAKVMVISKAPGMTEAREQRHFLGPDIGLLRDFLHENHVHDYLTWYVTAVIKHDNPTINGNFPKGWINNCLPILHNELRLVKPEFVWLLGTEAIKAVLGDQADLKSTVDKVIDKELWVYDEQFNLVPYNCKVITCLNPAAVIHDPSKRDDLGKNVAFFARQTHCIPAEVRDPESEREHITISNSDQLERLARRLKECKATEFAIDTEFEGDTPTDGHLLSIQFSWDWQKACAVNFRDERGCVTFGGGLQKARIILTDILKGDNKRLICHYAAADLWWLKAFGLGFLEDQFYVPLDDDQVFGWQKLRYQGGFDTILAAHAHEETAEFGLKDLAMRYTTLGNYELEMDKWKKTIPSSQLTGFQACPLHIRIPYSICDADATFRLYRLYCHGYNGRPAMLDCDRLGNSSWLPFWISMRAFSAFYEMHETGIHVDVKRAEELFDLYHEAKVRLLREIREQLRWPNFNPSSPIHCKEALFSEAFTDKIDRSTGLPVAVRPEGAVSLGLQPYKSTGKRPKLWDWVVSRGKQKDYSAAVDKETLEVYCAMYREQFPVIQTLLNLRYIQQVSRSILQPPVMRKTEEGDWDFEFDEDGNRVYEKGLLSFKSSRGTVHSNFSQTKETGRASSWKPPLQAIGKKREKDYKTILGGSYKYPLRSILVAPPGYAIVSADYTGAELYLMAIQARSAAMIDHCLRANLPSSGFNEAGEKCNHGKGCKQCVYPHIDYYDIHSNVAIKAFRPCLEDGTPCREGRLARFDLKRAKKDFLRDAAKPVDFGYAYGMTADAAYRKAKEGGADVTKDDAQSLLDGLEALYPELPTYYSQAAARSVYKFWIRNCFGRFRRTYPTDDRKLIADTERQFKNFQIQSGVADAVSLALANFKQYRIENPELGYRICLQVHDDIVSVVPIQQVSRYYHEVIPMCMTQKVDVWPADLDGVVQYDPNAPYHLVPDRHVYFRWSEDITKEQAAAAGLPLEFAS